MSDDEEQYYVEHILKKKWFPKERRYKYFVKWWDYPDSANEWIPRENFDGDDMVEKFEAKLEREKRDKQLNQQQSSTSSGNTSSRRSMTPKVKNQMCTKSAKTLLAEDNESINGDTNRVSENDVERSTRSSSSDSSTGTSNMAPPPPPVQELEEIDDPIQPFNPTSFSYKKLEDEEEDGFTRGWAIEKLVDILCGEEGQVDGINEKTLDIIVKFSGFKHAQLIPMQRVEAHVERAVFTEFMKEKLRKSALFRQQQALK